MKLSAAMVGVFMLAAGPAAANSVEVAPDYPENACSAWLEKNEDEAQCKQSLAYWTDNTAREIEGRLESGEGYRIFGAVDAPVGGAVPQAMPAMDGKIYAANVKAQCADIRELDSAGASMAETVIASDKCMAAVYRFAGMEGLNTEAIGGSVDVMTRIANKLMQEQNKPAVQGP